MPEPKLLTMTESEWRDNWTPISRYRKEVEAYAAKVARLREALTACVDRLVDVLPHISTDPDEEPCVVDARKTLNP